MISENDVRKLLDLTGVISEGHYCFAKGYTTVHSSLFVGCKKLIPYSQHVDTLMMALANHWAHTTVDTVVVPGSGISVFGSSLARSLDRQSKRPGSRKAIWADRIQGNFMFHNGFAEHVKGQRILLLEDVVTTARSVAEVRDLVTRCGGEVVGVAAIVNRSSNRLDTVFHRDDCCALLNLPAAIYRMEDGRFPDCPGCLAGHPITPPPDQG